jgi:hypothetical protein
MSEQDAPMDALDRRLASYLEGRAEAAVAFGPGPDRVVASIAAGGHRFVLPGRRGNAGLRVPTLAWALLMMGLLAAMAFALGVGSGPDDSLVVLPPASPAPSVEAPATTGDASALSGTWGLDLEASGIDDTYGNPGASPPGSGGTPQEGLRFYSGMVLEPDGTFRMSSGAGAGCESTGTWQVVGERLAVDVPTESNVCEVAGPGPAAKDIRLRIARAERFAIGATLTLLDKDGDQLLVFYRTTDGCLWCPPSEAPAGTWILDFEASGIDGWYVATGGSGGGPRGQKMPVSSSIEFAAGVVRGGTGAGGGCDFFEGTYSDADGGLTIEVPDAAGKCGGGPVYPDLEVRQHFGRTAAWQVDGDELRLLDDDGALLLLYRRPPIDAP